MMKPSSPPTRLPLLKSLRFQIVAGIVIILSIILFLLGQVSIHEQRNRMMAQMNEYGTETALFIAQISVVPIQKYSIYQLENYVAQLEKGKLISYCEIYDASGNALAHSTKASAYSDNRPDVDLLMFTQDIVDEGTRLGHVVVGLNPTPVQERIDKTSKYIGIAFLVELLIIGFAVGLFIHTRLVSPILKLSNTTRSISSGNFITSDQAERNDELGILAKSINGMSANLNELYRNLEEKVERRTEALTEAKNASEKTARNLRIVSSELQALLDNSPVAILFVNPERVIQRVNKEFSTIFGFSDEEAVGQSTRILYRNEGDFRNAAIVTYNILKRQDYCEATLDMQRKDGTPITCSLRGRLTMVDEHTRGIIWSIEDITARLQMEDELLKTKKLESIGVLAGGIAHDFNNILVAIIGNISLAEQLIGGNQQVAKLLQNSKNASLRAKDLTFKLLTFAKGGEPVKSIGSLPEILMESASFVLSGSNVKCHFDFEEDLWAVPMDKGQINQVIQNLILNADQSMEEGGTITIRCRNTVLSDNEVGAVRSGKYVRIEIIDTGSGIDPEVIDSIFDPYFSTKEKSGHKGSGLGLSIVHSIIAKHNGTIIADSEPGRGTTFTAYLPATELPPDRAEDKGSELSQGKGRILLMDDEETIHLVGEEMLEYLGYETVHAYDGREALAIYRREMDKGRKIDIVIMDLTIPGGMGGNSAIKELLAMDAHAKAIVSSGYSDDPLIQNYQKAGFSNIISKPYQLMDLSRVLSETLAS